MEKLKEALAKVVKGLEVQKPLRARAVRRYKANRKRAYIAHNQAIMAENAADRLRKAGRIAKSRRKDKKAGRLHTVAFKNSKRAEHYLGATKVYSQRIYGLKSRATDIEAEIKKLEDENKLKFDVDNNKVTGGTPRQRLKGAALLSAKRCVENERRNFYSQGGLFTANKCFTGENSQERSDCSQWFASVYKAAGLADPSGQNYTAGYTGTLVANGKQVSVPEPGDAIIYGPGVGHHVEMYVGPGVKTIGHGSAPIDPGVIDLFGDGEYRFFRYV